MISTSCFALNWKTLPLVLVVFAVFTVSLSETIQISDGFLSQSTAGWKYQLSPGESDVFTWTLTNTEDKSIIIEFRAEGQGSELFVFEELVTMEPKQNRAFEFIVVVPDDHPNNIEYRPLLYALEKAIPDSEGGAAILINYQMIARPIVLIGDDPVFTPEPIPIAEPVPEAIEAERPMEEDFSITPEETLEEKLARIAIANKGVKVDDTWQETFEEEAVPELQVDDNYLPEPTPEPVSVDPMPEPVIQADTEEKVECDFIAMILSWFGFGKC
jgi:hypothetical protein